MSQLEQLADTAVFERQLDSRSAIKFIQQQAKDISETEIKFAIRAATTFHKKDKKQKWKS